MKEFVVFPTRINRSVLSRGYDIKHSGRCFRTAQYRVVSRVNPSL